MNRFFYGRGIKLVYKQYVLNEATVDAVSADLGGRIFGTSQHFFRVYDLFDDISGILRMGDSATLGRIGKSVIARFVIYSFAFSTAALCLSLPFLKLDYSENQ